MRAAAIDIGSNSILLTIAEPGSPKSIPLKILFDECQVTGLSKGLQAGENITDAAQARAFECLRHYRSKIDEFKPNLLRAIGTESFRRAKNGPLIQKQISEILGTELEIISGHREAELSFWSVQKEYPESKKEKLVFDIGGASTELCLGSESGILERTSLKVGSVVLSEKFNLLDSCDPKAAHDYVIELLRSLPWAQQAKSAVGIGVAGTMTSLVAIELKLKDYDRNRVHGHVLSNVKIRQWRDTICALPLAKRKQLAGLQADRADVFSGGLTIVHAITEFFGWKNLVCMDSGIRFGALYELLKV